MVSAGRGTVALPDATTPPPLPYATAGKTHSLMMPLSIRTPRLLRFYFCNPCQFGPSYEAVDATPRVDEGRNCSGCSAATSVHSSEPSTGLHPFGVDRLLVQLDAGNRSNTVIEHAMHIVATRYRGWTSFPAPATKAGAWWRARPTEVAQASGSRAAPYLARMM
jgi:hypothetical protein